MDCFYLTLQAFICVSQEKAGVWLYQKRAGSREGGVVRCRGGGDWGWWVVVVRAGVQVQVQVEVEVGTGGRGGAGDTGWW